METSTTIPLDAAQLSELARIAASLSAVSLEPTMALMDVKQAATPKRLARLARAMRHAAQDAPDPTAANAKAAAARLAALVRQHGEQGT